MPFVRVELMEGKSTDFKKELSNIIYETMVETINCPPLDRFQVISEHKTSELIYDPTYFEINRTDNIIIIQITLNEGRTIEQKKALYQKLAQELEEKLGIRPEDLFINLVEVKKENWSLGKGVASYA